MATCLLFLFIAVTQVAFLKAGFFETAFDHHWNVPKFTSFYQPNFQRNYVPKKFEPLYEISKFF